jgi:hypothetical protein
VLSFADTSLRTTVAMRDQAAGAANADGAAKIAINALRQGTYSVNTGGTCFSGGSTLTLSNFYQPAGGAPDSAVVTCAQDTTNSAADPNVAISAANKPGNAILTLGTSGAEDGINLKVSGGRTLKVHGGIFSNSNIDVELGRLETDTSVAARGACTTGAITSVPAATCNLGAVSDPRAADPNYSPPSGSATAQTVPACRGNGNVVTFTPGLYTGNATANALNNLTKSSGCKDAIFWFPPGTYYFDLPENKPWQIDTGYVVGGLATLVDGTPPPIPGACASPIPLPPPATGWVKPPPNSGVQFVFGGATQLQLSATKFELCGTYSATRPPIAVYGLKADSNGVPAQSGCVIQVGGCPVITSDNSPNSRFYVQGTTYVPKASLDISLNNATGQVFRYGVVARSLSLNPTGSANLSNPVIEVPDDSPGYGLRTTVYLTVYVCPGVSTCTTATGKLRLRIKVGLIDTSGVPVAGARQVTVYSWSVQR